MFVWKVRKDSDEFDIRSRRTRSTCWSVHQTIVLSLRISRLVQCMQSKDIFVGVVEGDEELAEFDLKSPISPRTGTVAVSSPSSGSSYFSSHLRGGSVVIFDLKDMISVLENKTIVVSMFDFDSIHS